MRADGSYGLVRVVWDDHRTGRDIATTVARAIDADGLHIIRGHEELDEVPAGRWIADMYLAFPMGHLPNAVAAADTIRGAGVRVRGAEPIPEHVARGSLEDLTTWWAEQDERGV